MQNSHSAFGCGSNFKFALSCLPKTSVSVCLPKDLFFRRVFSSLLNQSSGGKLAHRLCGSSCVHSVLPIAVHADRCGHFTLKSYNIFFLEMMGYCLVLYLFTQ
jgi:hypothetical protein